MSRSEGFVLPVMLILMLMLSLMVTSLYETIDTHLTLFSAVQSHEALKDSLPELKQNLLKEVETVNQNREGLIPSPSPQDNSLYLRAIDEEHSIWQERTKGFLFTMECDTVNSCKIFKIRRL